MLRFYSNVYASTNPTRTDIVDYLQDNIPTMMLTSEHQELLENDITEQEVLSMIGSLHNNKMPGEDGLASEFYKAY